MRKIAITLVLALSALSICGQTLRDVLDRAGIPTGQVPPSELAKNVNATSGKDGLQTYLAYVTVGANNLLTDDVGLVRYDSATNAVLLHNLKPSEMENCCGSPLDIEFTHSYILVSFHDNPSASTVLVAGKDLKYRTTLYGNGFYEVSPDQVVYPEDTVHFAAQHPERLAWADLKTGQVSELYPPKGDPLRAEFEQLNRKHMPPMADCQRANDPCDPGVYDETIEILGQTDPEGFSIRVTRDGHHPWVTKDAEVDAPVAVATYRYRRDGAEWVYCETADVAAQLAKSIDQEELSTSAKSCEPHWPVVPDASGDSPFSPHAGKAN